MKLFVSPRLGDPLSVTLTVTTLVVFAKASAGVQVIKPAGLTVKPPGPETRPKVSVWAGRSVSVAVALVASNVVAWMVWSGGIVNTGALFPPMTIKV